MGGVFHRAHKSFEHQIEHARLGQFSPAVGAAFSFFQLVRPPAHFTFFAVHHRVGKSFHMTGGFPDSGMHQNAGIDAFDVVPFVHHGFPPQFFNIFFQFNSQRAVIVTTVNSAVNFAALKYKSAALGQRRQFVHQGLCVLFRHNNILLFRFILSHFQVPGFEFSLPGFLPAFEFSTGKP